MRWLSATFVSLVFICCSNHLFGACAQPGPSEELLAKFSAKVREAIEAVAKDPSVNPEHLVALTEEKREELLNALRRSREAGADRAGEHLRSQEVGPESPLTANSRQTASDSPVDVEVPVLPSLPGHIPGLSLSQGGVPELRSDILESLPEQVRAAYQRARTEVAQEKPYATLQEAMAAISQKMARAHQHASTFVPPEQAEAQEPAAASSRTTTTPEGAQAPSHADRA